MLDTKSVQIPFPTDSFLSLQFGANLSDPTKYQVVGSLEYLLRTRLDIAFVVNKLSQFMHKLTTEHWDLVKRLFRYLFGTLHSLYMHFQMLIGQETDMISPPLVLTLYILGAILFPGVAR